MARVRAADYEEKRDHVVEVAARLFAERGYSNTTMKDVAEACGSSKAKAYYYFPKKNDLLFKILLDYCEEILSSFHEINNGAGTHREKLKAFIVYYVACAPTMRNRHILMAKDMHFLSPEEQETIKDYSRELATLMSDLIAQVNPALKNGPARSRTSAFFLFGMLNNIHHWYKDTGPMPVADLGDFASRIFMDGLVNVDASPTS